MEFREQIFKFVVISLSYTAICGNCGILLGNSSTGTYRMLNSEITFPVYSSTHNISGEVEKLNKNLLDFLTIDDLASSKNLAMKLIQKLKAENINDKTLSDSYYYLGIYYLKSKNIDEAIRYLILSKSIKEKNKEVDIRYSRILYNISVAYSTKGDLDKFGSYAENSLEVGKKVFDKMDPNLLGLYLSLVSAYVDQKEYEKAIDNSNKALTIANS